MSYVPKVIRVRSTESNPARFCQFKQDLEQESIFLHYTGAEAEVSQKVNTTLVKFFKKQNRNVSGAGVNKFS